MNRFKVIIWMSVVLIVAGFWISPIGYLAVSIACSEDGGEHIYRTVFVDGYTFDDQGSRCVDCLSDVGSKRFKFVDREIRNSHPLTTRPGFYRYSLGDMASERCSRWRTSEWGMSHNASFGLGAGECIVLEPVQSMTRYHFKPSRFDTDGPLFTRLQVTEYEIADVNMQQTLAITRNYEYIPIIKRELFEWSGPVWQCNSVPRPFHPRIFRQRVLRDASKQARP